MPSPNAPIASFYQKLMKCQYYPLCCKILLVPCFVTAFANMMVRWFSQHQSHLLVLRLMLIVHTSLFNDALCALTPRASER